MTAPYARALICVDPDGYAQYKRARSRYIGLAAQTSNARVTVLRSDDRQPFETERILSWLTQTVKSGIGRKALVAISGLGLVGFLIAHLSGNLLIYKTPEAGQQHPLNEYAENLHNVPGFTLIELGLLFLFVMHIALVISLTLENRRARGPVGYSVSKTKKKSGLLNALASRTMAISGVTVLVFLAVHIADFRLKRGGDQGPAEMIMTALSEPWRAALYVIGSLLVGWHLFHGFQSAFRSVGVNHPKYTPWIVGVGTFLAVALALGFASIPVWVFLKTN